MMGNYHVRFGGRGRRVLIEARPSRPYAELGAAFLSNEAGILDNLLFQNSAAYLQSWISKLEDDNRLIISAASAAQRSTDFVLGIQQKEAIITDDIIPVSIERAEKQEATAAILTKQQPQRDLKRGISI